MNLEKLNMRCKRQYSEQDAFFLLKRPTITKIRVLFEWVHKYAMSTRITLLDCNQSFRRLPADKGFEEVVGCINRKAKPYFRIILRKNQNWYLLLTNKKHIEDLIEIAIRSIDIGGKEYFIQCFLKKEFMGKLRRKFELSELR